MEGGSMSMGKRFLAMAIALLLILFGIRGVALSLIGESARAVITETSRVVDQSSDKLDHDYRIAYRFQIEGKTYTGAYRMRKVYNITHLPSTGDTVSVRYLAGFPQWNGNARDGPLTGLLVGGVGVLILGAALKPGRRPAAPAQDT